jgi:hypothetical protein
MTSDDEPWVKTVRGKTMLIPTVELVRKEAEAAAGLDARALRQALASRFGTDATCPVTMRRHLKTLGILQKNSR